MAKASIQDLRYHFAKVEVLLDRAKPVEITRRGRVIARLVLPELSQKRAKMPDFAKRRKDLWGDRVFPPTTELLDEIRKDKI
jgi:antitoxin (DNA-binding transcriptional repressor) of toxin-antitoxin stability system